QRPLATVYLLQIAILGGGASIIGALLGSLLALVGSRVVESQVPIGVTASGLFLPAFVAFFFGLLTAFAFTFPAIGRALTAKPAALFRGNQPGVGMIPMRWWLASLVCLIGLIALVLLALPDALFGLGFVALIALLLVMLEMILRVIRRFALTLESRPGRKRSFAIHLALANLHRPGSSLRSSLLSLGSALTLLVACTLVVASLLRALNTTIPQEAPAMVFYDVLEGQAEAVENAILQSGDNARAELVPLVRSRISAVNGLALAEREDTDQANMQDMARGDYKLSYRAGNIDDVTLIEGQWWQEPVSGRARMAMEDREVNRLGLKLGDVLTFTAAGRSVDAEIQVIYKQKGLQTRFWFEGILSNGAIDEMIVRRVGAAFLDDDDAIQAQKQIAAVAPNVISVRTAQILDTARGLLGKAASGLAVVAGISLLASLLVLTSVMAAGRTRQIYDATVLHTLGARLKVIRQGLQIEYLLLAVVTSIFAILLGAAIALPLLHYRLKLPGIDLLWIAALIAFLVSSLSLALGARYLLMRLKVNPVTLLRGN
ncbi:MAG: ABC transporter permease, partial [Pseudomonadota bacterium]